jgi:hypothetical protein
MKIMDRHENELNLKMPGVLNTFPTMGLYREIKKGRNPGWLFRNQTVFTVNLA